MGHPLRELSGKTAVVIGGTRGIGLTLAKSLGTAGANVIATGRRAELAAVAAREIETQGPKSLAITCDVSRGETLQLLLHAVLQKFGSVEILLNCTGRTKRTPTFQLTDEEWNSVLETNLTGTLRACRIFGRHMVERKYGRVINIASLSSFVALFEVAAYSASKSAACHWRGLWRLNGHNPESALTRSCREIFPPK